jgi:PAS domain S-box-containing protein
MAASDLVPVRNFLTGGGEMADLIRNFDWRTTPLGPIEDWPQSLKTSVSLILSSQHPMWIGWGPAISFLYNDAYLHVLGPSKHPWALGRPAAEVWAEIWDVCGPLARKVFDSGEATFLDEIRLFMSRGEYLEETFYSFSYSPIRDETGNVGGLFCPSTDVTPKVLNTRRLRVLSELAANALLEKTIRAACASALATLAKGLDDVPFTLLYLIEAEGGRARLEGSVGLLEPTNSIWPLDDVVRTGQWQRVGLSGLKSLPQGPANQSVTEAVVLPVAAAGQEKPVGILIAGINPTRKLDNEYHAFFELVAGQVGMAIQNARAAEEEKIRADRLAEIDRAKTVFFSNVSHEFRTPLTLMLGPLEHVLGKDGSLAPADREQIATAHRNSLRLLKLVNSLLDFSRIEAGRVNAAFEPLDLAAVTADLASNFRSVLEAAGLQLVVDCEALEQPVYVDREMWEKIVLNLLSNAFKFTFKGSVSVQLKAEAGEAALTVSDTGVGIPESELPHLFKRFHRVEGAKGRTYEGTGIGLALILELVKLHGGRVAVQSRQGEGSGFTVRIPFGKAHLPEERIVRPRQPEQSRQRTGAYSSEAMSWITRDRLAYPSEDPVMPAAGTTAGRRNYRILLADDNADMREHIAHMLGMEYALATVANGAAALVEARRRRPDLILTDVMMPELDGFGLLRELRADPKLREVPVILLSARAGEEARTEGIAAGADDYLTKPFSARELMARIRTTLELDRVRREAREQLERTAKQYETLLNQAPMGVYLVDSNFRIRDVNPIARAMFGEDGELDGRDFAAVVHQLLPEERACEVVEMFRRTLETGESFHSAESASTRHGRRPGEYYEWRIDRIPLPDGSDGVVCYFRDVSAQVAARQAIADSEARFRALLSLITDVVWTAEASGRFAEPQPAWAAYTGQTWEQLKDFGWIDAIHPEDRERVRSSWLASCAARTDFQADARLWHARSQTWRDVVARATPVAASGEAVREWVGSYTDVHDQREAEAKLRETQKLESLGVLAGGIAHDFNNLLTGMLGNASLLSETLAGSREAETAEALVEASERMARLTQQMLAYSGKGRLVVTSLDLSHEVTRIATLIHASIPKHVELHLTLAKDIPFVEADASQIQQVVMNLVINAAESIGPEGGTVELTTASRQLTDRPIDGNLFPRNLRAGPYVCVTVTDTGCGMDEQTKSRIFDPFFTTKFTGRGLGLSAVLGAVRGHKGLLTVKSSPGSGTTFEIYLPASDEPLVRPGAPSTTAIPAQGSGTILVVDDEDVVQRIARTALERAGYRVLTAWNGQEGLDLYAAHRSEIVAVLLDLTMPKMDGAETLRRLRELDESLAVIASSGYDETNASKHFGGGITAFLQKPYKASALAYKISSVLNRSNP